MRATANVIASNITPEVRIEHEGESISFSISVYGRTNFQTEYDVFEHINEYWGSLPTEQQKRIFEIYKEIKYGFDNIFTKDALFDFITTKVTELIEIHNLDNIQNWISYKSNIMIPSSFETEFVESIDNNTSREKTYTRYDYLRLVSLSVLLRCMVPVWGEYISNTRQETGTQFKEFYAFQLLSHSNVAHCVPMEKLKIYIDNIVGVGKNDPNITLNGILNGISSEDFGYWLLSLVCIRRLCIGDIRGLDPKQHLITFIYKFIIQKIRNNDGNVESIVKEKKSDDKGVGEENKISTLERYKVKGDISNGEIVELEYSIRDLGNVAQKLSYNVDENILNRSLRTCQELLNQRLLDPQVTLLRWVFKPAISPKGLMFLPKSTIVNALGILEAVLWARGHKYLALLASSYPIISDREMVVSPIDSKMRVPQELSDALDQLYPYTRTTINRKIGVKEINLAAKSIDILTDNLSMFTWRPTASDEMLQEVLGNTNRRLPIKPDIKTDLTKLVIEIGSRNW